MTGQGAAGRAVRVLQNCLVKFGGNSVDAVVPSAVKWHGFTLPTLPLPQRALPSLFLPHLVG